MSGSWLTAYWIVPPSRTGPIGFGVTAFSLKDALDIIRSDGYGDYLPDDPQELQGQMNVTANDLDQANVAPNIGSIIMRGMWYPCQNLGWPRL